MNPSLCIGEDQGGQQELIDRVNKDWRSLLHLFGHLEEEKVLAVLVIGCYDGWLVVTCGEQYSEARLKRSA